MTGRARRCYKRAMLSRAGNLCVPVLALGLTMLSACVPPREEGYQPPGRGTPMPAPPRPEAPARDTPGTRWQPREVVRNAKPVAGQTYVVQSGDSLSVIADRTGSATRAIGKANGLPPPYTIYPGQRLAIPGGRYHRVNRGETGIAIALAYGVPWDAIVAANNLQPPYLLRVGDRLLLPDSQPVRTADSAPGRRPAETATTPPQTQAPEQMAAFDIDIDDIITGGEPAQPPEAPPPQTAKPRAPVPFDGRFAWPVEGKLVSGYGAKEGGLYNDGINIAAPKGTKVRAAASGTVIYAGNGIRGWGNLVLVKHDDEWVSAYAHNDAFYVERGDSVSRGDVIAEVGETGSVESPQLHFELRRGRRAIDPRDKLPAS
ncbi:LysM peptidoglycan-binding domain-containing M23 family metallopeptidase [Pacificimonas flava]|uniref:Peptidase M23B n=1 Tax=Pacificimonas flava TaxID=1234595 RepID=M2TQB3_9SPHN|nr:LysM peptidoglycan-binding domain-containing M23 family metallopeptidase [Pacificimonas flava]EMD83946.1 peptidase M23B [Pacificimonas flava]